MEIPVVNRISDFEVSTSLAKTPSFPSSQSFSISSIEKVYSIWQWGALILVIIASFGTIIAKFNILVLRQLRYNNNNSIKQPLISVEEDDFSDIDDDDDYSVSSSLSVSDDDEEEDERRDEDFYVKGKKSNLRLRRGRSFGGMHRFSWSDFACGGKSVVKLWDNLALGLDLDDEEDDDSISGGKVVSIYDMNKQKKVSSFFAGSFQAPAAATSSTSRSTILAADTSSSATGTRASVGVWDTRVGGRIPAMLADWGPQIGRIVGVASGGVGKVYVKDDVTGDVTVGDVRKVGAPLRRVTGGDVDGNTWWDADAVIVSDECFDESCAAGSGSDSAMTRCCSAVRSYLL